MKVTVESEDREETFPISEMGANGDSIGIITDAPEWSKDIGTPVFFVKYDLWYQPHDDTYIEDTDSEAFHYRRLRDNERIVIEND